MPPRRPGGHRPPFRGQLSGDCRTLGLSPVKRQLAMREPSAFRNGGGGVRLAHAIVHVSQPTYVDAPLVGKPDVVPKSVAVRSGTVVCAASWCGTFLAAGPYGVREIGSKSQWRARWPIVGYWFFRPRLVDRLPLPCPPSCLPSPVGTFPGSCPFG